jgi:hypothetical protein
MQDEKPRAEPNSFTLEIGPILKTSEFKTENTDSSNLILVILGHNFVKYTAALFVG